MGVGLHSRGEHLCEQCSNPLRQKKDESLL
jgi:hypothetical protein